MIETDYVVEREETETAGRYVVRIGPYDRFYA